jgi:hypothetical protein
MTAPQEPAKTAEPTKHGSVTAGVKSGLDGVFTGNVKVTLEGFQLGDLGHHIGQLSVFGGDLEIKYPFGAGPMQAALGLNYLHWKLPQLGPVLSEAVFRGAYNYALDNNWSFSEGFEARLRTTYVKRLELRIGFDFKVENKKNVETQGVITNISATYNF